MKSKEIKQRAKDPIFLFGIMFIFVMVVGMASALQFDNVKETLEIKNPNYYSLGEKNIQWNPIWEKYPPIQINNTWGIGDNVLFKGAIVEHTDSCSSDCLSKLEIYTNGDEPLVDSYYTLVKVNGEWVKKDIKRFNLFLKQTPSPYQVEDYNYQKIGTWENGSDKYDLVNTGSHTEYTPEWVKYDLGTIYPEGNYILEARGLKSSSQEVDWVIETNGEVLDEWAVWGNITTGDSGEVTLHSPANDSSLSSSEVQFIASANNTAGDNLVNISLYTNEGGTWAARNTTTNAGLGTEDAPTISAAGAGVGDYNTTMTAIKTGYINSVRLGSTDGTTGNVSVNIWQGGIKLATNYTSYDFDDANSLATATFTQAAYSSTLSTGTFIVEVKKIGAPGNVVFVTGQSFSGSKFSYTTQSVARRHASAADSALFQYTETIGGNTTQSWNRTITEDIVWNVLAWDDAGGFGFAPNNFTLNLDPLIGICNSTLTTKIANITFKDEGSLASINASIPSSTWVYSTDLATNKTFTYNNANNNLNYTLCSNLATTIYVDPSVQYKNGTSYPQRTWSPTLQTYNSTMTTEILYLLSSTDGIFVTFQVINAGEQTIQGAFMNASRSISGSDVIVGQGTTDAAGSVTFWLNPDFQHTIGVLAGGFDYVQTILFPTQSSYTINLGGTGVGTVPNDYTKGMAYSTAPKTNQLTNDTNYEFNYTLTSSSWTVEKFGFTLKLDNGTIVGSNSSTTNGGFLKLTNNTGNYTEIIMDYYWLVDGNFTNLTRHWIVYNDQYTGWSISNFFTDLNAYVTVGIFGLDTFGLHLIVYIIIFVSVGIMSFKYGFNSPLAVSTSIFGVIYFFDVVVGLMPNPIGAIPNFPTFAAALLLVLLVIKEMKR